MPIYPTAGSTLTSLLVGRSALKSGDQSVTSSTTLVNDSALALPLTGGVQYSFTCWLYIVGTTAKVTFTFGGSGQWSQPNGGTVVTASGTTVTAAAGGWLIAGTVTAASGGDTLQLEWAQSSSSGTATTVKGGSILTTLRMS